MGITRVEQLKRWIEARKRILAATRDGQVARLCLLWIARDQAELDRIETIYSRYRDALPPIERTS